MNINTWPKSPDPFYWPGPGGPYIIHQPTILTTAHTATISPAPALPQMTLALGTPVFFLEPHKTVINIDELLIHAENLCRYVGARRVFLLDHLALCIHLMDYRQPNHINSVLDHIEIQKGYAGIHDLHEGIVGDVSTHLKKLLPEYQKIENIWEIHTHESLGLPYDLRNKEYIKSIDQTAMYLEMTLTHHPAEWRHKPQWMTDENYIELYDLTKKVLRQRASTKKKLIKDTVLTARQELIRQRHLYE